MPTYKVKRLVNYSVRLYAYAVIEADNKKHLKQKLSEDVAFDITDEDWNTLRSVSECKPFYIEESENEDEYDIIKL
jgi:hypothetical protein